MYKIDVFADIEITLWDSADTVDAVNAIIKPMFSDRIGLYGVTTDEYYFEEEENEAVTSLEAFQDLAEKIAQIATKSRMVINGLIREYHCPNGDDEATMVKEMGIKIEYKNYKGTVKCNNWYQKWEERAGNKKVVAHFLIEKV